MSCGTKPLVADDGRELITLSKCFVTSAALSIQVPEKSGG